MGPTPLMLFATMLLIARNQRILHAWNARQEENTRRAAKGLSPKTRRRRRKNLTALTAAPPLPWPAKPPGTHATSTNATTTTARARPDTKTQARNSKTGASDALSPPGTSRTTVPPETSGANVKLGLTQT